MTPDHRQPTDATLLQRVAKGDSSALKALMDRYDRLVRYTIFKTARRQCQKDPQWLDSVASATWFGMVKTLQKRQGPLPDSTSAFLVVIARNQSISSLRQVSRYDTVNVTEADGVSADFEAATPDENLENLETIERIHELLMTQSESDKLMMSSYNLIVDRKWTDAADKLGWSESTLRSRWSALLERIRAHFASSRFSVAPKKPPCDHKD